MRIFIDTSAFYALLDRDDANHQKAKKVWADLLRADHTLVTSNYVLVETFALLQNRLTGIGTHPIILVPRNKKQVGSGFL